MKKFTNILFLGVILFLTSCSSNESDTTITDADLVGTWNMTDFHSENGSVSYTESGNTITLSYAFTGSNFNAQVTFGDNPKVVTGTGNFTLETSYTFMGQTESNSENVNTNDASNMPGTNWSIENGNITFTMDGESSQAEIMSFDGNTLELKTTLDQNVNEQGFEGTLTGSVFITLTK